MIPPWAVIVFGLVVAVVAFGVGWSERGRRRCRSRDALREARLALQEVADQAEYGTHADRTARAALVRVCRILRGGK